jgi:hypothetical protein
MKALAVLIDAAPAPNSAVQSDRWDNLLAEYGIAPEGNSGRFSDFEKGH